MFVIVREWNVTVVLGIVYANELSSENEFCASGIRIQFLEYFFNASRNPHEELLVIGKTIESPYKVRGCES